MNPCSKRVGVGLRIKLTLECSCPMLASSESLMDLSNLRADQ